MNEPKWREDSLVYIFERLKIREVNHHEEGLFKRVGDYSCLVKNLMETLFDDLRRANRHEHRATNINRARTKPSACGMCPCS